jgi:hypothetical protein
MAATLTLDTITSSGSEIEIPTGKTLVIADAGALKINNVAITTGAQGVLSKTASYTILAADFTGKSSLIVLVNASAGTSTEAVITLPAASAFGTCAIHVVSTHAHGSGNKITIKNSSAVEQYTLYKIGDHCEFVSDATNIFRTGNEWVSVEGFVFNNTNESVAAGGTENIIKTATHTVREDLGGWWNSTNLCADVPWSCRLLIECFIWTQSHAEQYLAPSIKRYFSSRGSNEWIFRPDNKSAAPTAGWGPSFLYDLTTGDEIEYNAFNEHVSTACTMSGGANGWYQGSYAKWTVMRRF